MGERVRKRWTKRGRIINTDKGLAGFKKSVKPDW